MATIRQLFEICPSSIPNFDPFFLTDVPLFEYRRHDRATTLRADNHKDDGGECRTNMEAGASIAWKSREYNHYASYVQSLYSLRIETKLGEQPICSTVQFPGTRVPRVPSCPCAISNDSCLLSWSNKTPYEPNVRQTYSSTTARSRQDLDGFPIGPNIKRSTEYCTAVIVTIENFRKFRGFKVANRSPNQP